MGNRKKKAVCITLPPELNKIWGEYAVANGTNKSAMIEAYLVDCLSKWKEEE